MQFRYHILLILCFLIQVQAVQVYSQSCEPPIIFTSNEITDTSVVLRWFALNEPDSFYQIDIRRRGLPPRDSGKLVEASSDRDTFYGLEPQTSYTAYIRSICETDTSLWKAFDFTTALRNGSACQLELPLLDNNCSNRNQRIPLYVHGFEGQLLGQHIKLESVQLIIAHPYPADLTIRLINPGGTSITLVENHGSITDNFGNPADSSCEQATVFTQNSCQSIYDIPPPFLADLRPDQNLDLLNDGSEAKGRWVLEICDRASDDIGVLQHVFLSISEQLCPTPPQLRPLRLGDTSQIVGYRSSTADSMLIMYSNEPEEPSDPRDTGFVALQVASSDSVYEIQDLLPDTQYFTWSFIYCDNQWIGPSCRDSFLTLPSPITHYSDWEDENICHQECINPCTLSSTLWSNSSAAWNVIKGPTATSSTGPERDYYLDGKYLYKEASVQVCREQNSILESNCLERTNSDENGLAAYFHMSGTDLGELKLLISSDEWSSADTLFKITGDQGEEWQFIQIPIPPQFPEPLRLRWVASEVTGAFGDIAIGDMALYGLTTVSLSEQVFYWDSDKDGFGNSDSLILYCTSTTPEQLSKVPGDCNDQDSLIHPDAQDIACNQIDENCDGIFNRNGAENLEITVDSLVKPSCPEDTNGFIQIKIEGGIPPYSILWSTNDSSHGIQNLSSGLYTVQVSDSANCQSTSSSIPLTSERPVSFSFEILQRPSCPQPSTGSVKVNLGGGTPPYQIQWSNGEQGPIADSLPAGVFYLEVTDSSGCFFRSDSQKLTPTQAYQAEIVRLKEISCPESADGSLRAIASGSTPPLMFRWSNGDTSQNLTNLGPGNYSVTITDAEGCSIVSETVSLTPPEPLEIEQILVDPQKCGGTPDAALSVMIKGGTPPYSFRWLGPEQKILTGSALHQLLPGYYQLSVTDNKGCLLLEDSIHVPEQAPIVLKDLEVRSSSCPLSKDGQIRFNVSGGEDPYKIFWSDGTRGLQTRESLQPGIYGITITDELNCKFTFNDLLVKRGNKSLKVKLNTIDSLFCTLNDKGAIQASLQEGAPPFSYNWSAGIQNTKYQRTDTLDSLEGGKYEVTVTDGIGCVGISEPLELDSFAPIQLQKATVIPPDCAGSSNGSVQITAESAAGGLVYQWSNGSDSCCLDSLEGGTYQLTLSDNSNCRPRIVDFHLNEPEPIQVEVDTFIDGSAYCFQLRSVKGGNEPYVIYWLSGEDSIEGNLLCVDSSSSTTVHLEVRDAKKCFTSYLVYEGNSTLSNQPYLNVEVFPNPFTDRIYIENRSGGPLTLHIYNEQGKLLKHKNIPIGKTELDGMNQPTGLYILELIASNGNKDYRKVILIR